MIETADVAVVGAGVIGCAVAYYLSLEGARVVLLDREAVGSGGSAHATGSLSLLGTEFSPGPSFLMGLESYLMFGELAPQLEEETGIDLQMQRRSSLRLALDEDEERLVRELMDWQRERVSMGWIDGGEVRRLEPRLSTSIRGAVYEDESAQLESYRLTLALAAAAESHGARVIIREAVGLDAEHRRVTGVRCVGGHVSCGSVVLATGSWSADCSQWLDFPVPVRPLKGERLLLQYDGAPLAHLISSPKRGHMISLPGGLLSVGSTGGRDYDRQELFLGLDFDRRPTEPAKLELLKRAVEVLPDVAGARLVRQLAGSRPLSADRMPIIGPVPGWEGVILATGHGTKGIHLAPATGRVVADYVLRGKTESQVDMRAFLPARFAGEQAHDYWAAGEKAEE